MPLNKTVVSETPYGSMGILWQMTGSRARIVRILLSKPGSAAEDRIGALYPGSKILSSAGINNTAAAMVRFMQGEDITFSLDLIDLSACSPFQRKVLLAEYRIPRGRVSSYQLIAGHLGNKGGARAVGNALATNPFPIIIPCHRAIRSDRRLGGYQGGLEMKRRLLMMEGIRFDWRNRAICEDFYYGRGDRI